MTVTAIIGAQWGDEGKGKVVDYYSKGMDKIVRSAGGPNAGHTVYTPDSKKIILHQVPSGALYSDKTNLIGNGVVLDPIILVNKELSALEGCGYNPNLIIDGNTHVILEYHRVLDAAIEKEKSKNGKKVGTTGKGIGPAYAAKALRLAVRFEDLVDEQRLERRLNEILPFYIKFIGALDSLPEQYKPGPTATLEDCVALWTRDILTQLSTVIPKIDRYIGNVPQILREAINNGENILIEGAQGTLLDTDHGTYPMVTSSNSTIGGCITGTGIPPSSIDEVIGVAKAYVTRVGEGPFPTELKGEIGEKLQTIGGEFGSTTGRPRRCGWQDLVALKYATDINGITGFAITKLDILDSIEEINVCVAYRIDGEKVFDFPRDTELLAKAEPVLEAFGGWGKQDWKNIKNKEGIPQKAQDYLDFIAQTTEVPIKLVSVGSSREETIVFD